MPPSISQNLGPAMKAVGAYMARLEARIVKLERGSRAAQIGNTTIDSGALTVNDDGGNQVLSVGLQPDGTYAVANSGSMVPDAPSAPALGAGVLELFATWDGEMDDGSTPLSDFAAIQVYCSQDAGFIPDGSTLQGTLPGQGVFRIGALTAGVTYWVTFIAVNASGNQSDTSVYVSAQPLPVASAIEAGSLTAQQMGLPGGVLNPNPWFAGGYGGDWSAQNGTFAVVPASAAPPGIAYGNIGKYVNNGTAAGSMGENGGIFSATPSASYLVTTWVNSSSGAVSLGIAWTLAGTFQSTTTAALTVTAGAWTQVQAVVTAPASSVNGGYPVAGTQTGDSSTIYAVAILVLPSIPGTVIQAGTITADQIAAGTIVAGLVDGTTIIGATLEGGAIIGTGAGQELILYDGTPANDNMVVSAVSESGNRTNTGGGTVLPGIVYYGQTGGPLSELLALQITQFFGAAGTGPNGAIITPALASGTTQGTWTNTTDTNFPAPAGIPVGSIIFALQNALYNFYLSGSVGISNGLTVLGAGITSTAGTAAAPTLITTDTWHSLGSAGSTGCTLQQARYRLTPDGECEIDIALVATTGGSIAGTYTWGSTLPGTYQFPGNYARGYPMGFSATSTSGVEAPIILVDGAGTGSPGRVRITLPALASGVVITGTIRIPTN